MGSSPASYFQSHGLRRWSLTRQLRHELGLLFLKTLDGRSTELRLTLLGVGAMNSPRYAPAGMLVEYDNARVVIDGGPGAAPKLRVAAWLVTDERGELIRQIRKSAHSLGVESAVGSFAFGILSIKPRLVIHTSHDTYGYLIQAEDKKIVWAPEFLVFPKWAKSADLMFAEAAGWNRPILFRGGVGGHASVEQVARDAIKYKVKRLVFAHIGRPTIRAMDSGLFPTFGEFGADGDVYRLTEDGIFKQKARKRISQKGILPILDDSVRS